MILLLPLLLLQDLSRGTSGELSTAGASTETGARAVLAVTTCLLCPRFRA